MRELIRLSFNKRFRAIMSLFLSFVIQFWWLGKTKSFFSPQAQEKRYKELHKKQAQRYTAVATEMGALLIKLGQFFSARVDILPKEYTDELAKLQDNVAPVRAEIVMARLKAELGNVEDHFSYFSPEPVASASLGQVHAAVLKTGEKAAVKILRPGIEDVLQIDIEALKMVLAFAKRNEKIRAAADLDRVYEEFTSILFDELDYEKEGQNADRFRENFAEDPDVIIPRIYRELSTRKVLTMEFVEGIKITDMEGLHKFGIDQKALAGKFFSVFLAQIMGQRIIHADPHPGNILVNKEGQLIILDFGMVAPIDSDMEKNIINLAVNIYKKDGTGIVNAFDSMGFLRPSADKEVLVKSMNFILVSFSGKEEAAKGKNLSGLNSDMEELLEDLRELMYSQPFQLPAGTLFLGKALITVMGICNGLDKEFDMLKEAGPFVKDLLSGGEGKPGGLGLILDQAKKIVTDAIALPNKINHLIDDFHSGKIQIKPAKSFERSLLEQQERQLKKVTGAVLASGLIIAGSILYSGSFGTAGIIFMVLGGFLGIRALLGKGSPGQRRGGQGPGAMKAAGNSGFKKPRFHP